MKTAKEMTAIANAFTDETQKKQQEERDRLIEDKLMPIITERAYAGKFEAEVKIVHARCPLDMIIQKLKELGFTVKTYAGYPNWLNITWPKDENS